MEFAELAAMAGGHAEARAIQIALKLGVFEALAQGPHEPAEIAARIRCDERAVTILVNALAAVGILEKRDHRFDLSAVARDHLVESSPAYFGGLILFDGAQWETWGKLEDSIRTGRPARAADMFQNRPEETARFIHAMDSLVRARGDARWCADRIDLANARTIADIGGGPGTYLIEFLKKWPRLRGEIHDLPATLKIVRELLEAREPTLPPRIALREVNYISDEIPGPLDVIFMSNIIHSEGERTNVELMTKCFRALASGGLLIIKDHIMNAAMTVPSAGAVFSLYLLLTTRGRDYSFDEVAGWLRQAGFAGIIQQTLPTSAFTSSLVMARKL
ncbi:MAG: methyltransferase [Candidatus Binataceae bacterium]